MKKGKNILSGEIMNIRKLMLNAAPPFEWSNDESHPIHTLGYYHFGICDGFRFNEEAVEKADEELLKKIYGEIARYWCEQNICKDKYIKYINL